MSMSDGVIYVALGLAMTAAIITTPRLDVTLQKLQWLLPTSDVENSITAGAIGNEAPLDDD